MSDIFDAVNRVVQSATKHFLSIRLTVEQRASVKKALGVEFHELKLPPKPSIVMKYGAPMLPRMPNEPPINLRYGIILPPTSGSPPDAPPAIMNVYGAPLPMAERIILTDEQKRQIQRSTGCKPCDFIEVRPGMRTVYGVPVVGR